MRYLIRAGFLALIVFSCSAAQAEDYLTLGAGWFDINRSGDSAANFSGEWRGNPFYYGFRPVVGAAVNTDAGLYGYAGVDYDWQFMDRWAVVPGLAIGAWSRGNSIDLGGTFEFHESFEVDYKFDNDYRVGAQIAHTSNAGIYDTNPGANTLMATLSVPL